MNEQPEITEPEPLAGSGEFMDAAQDGQPFTVTRAEFAAMSRTAPGVCLDAFRADQDRTAEQKAGGFRTC